MRALRIAPDPDPPQDDVSDAVRHWAQRRREQLQEDRLDALVSELARLVDVLERRAS
ncbi:MAG TPA: hypothetical protein VGQ29_08485 [Gemmatimonadales bacterium]|jgi:hypothetical protein|nr:hypothetical protein [Gemmatimonadales bacterium]